MVHRFSNVNEVEERTFGESLGQYPELQCSVKIYDHFNFEKVSNSEMDEISFADKTRGIYAAKNGAVYICEPNTFTMKCSPLAVPAPFRILTGEGYDPLIIVFTESGNMMFYNYVELRWVLKTTLPPNVGTIDAIQIFGDGELNIAMKTSRGEFSFRNGGWSIISEPLELLVVQQDQKIFAQCSELENQIAAAISFGNFEMYEHELQRYLLCLAGYAPLEAFVAIWYSLIATKLPPEFNKDKVDEMWWRNLELVSSMDRVASLVDELRMSLMKR